jgi:hypothetical protein
MHGYPQAPPTTYTPPFTQNIAYAGLPAFSMPYANPMNRGQFVTDNSALITTSGPSFMSATPTCLADGIPTNEGLICDNYYTPSYGGAQFQAPGAYTDTNASVNPSDFFR